MTVAPGSFIIRLSQIEEVERLGRQLVGLNPGGMFWSSPIAHEGHHSRAAGSCYRPVPAAMTRRWGKAPNVGS